VTRPRTPGAADAAPVDVTPPQDRAPGAAEVISTASTPAVVRRAGLSAPRGGPAGSTLLRHLVLALVGAGLLWLLTGAVSANSDYQLAFVGMYVCVLAGLTLLTGLNGQVSLGHAALMGIGAYTVALLQGHWSDRGTTGLWVLPLSLVVATLVTAVAGAIVGAAAARLRGPYLAGATLALGVALPAVTVHFSSTFKGDQGLSVPVDPVPGALGVDFTPEHWQSWITLSAALLTLLLLANIVRSRVGRELRAVRDDEVAARLAGLDVARVQVLAFVISAACAGLGGGLFAVLLQNALPGAFSLVLSLTLLSGIVIGGLGTLTGAVWGALVVVYLGSKITDFTDGLGLSGAAAKKLHDNLPGGIYGLLLIVVMIAAPGGIQGLLRLLRRRATYPRSPVRPAPTDPGGHR